MDTIPRPARALLLALIAALLTLTGCASDINSAGDDLTVRPAAVTMPSGQVCQPWVNNPHEADIVGNGIRPCDYPMPTDRPVQQPGMSTTDFLALMFLFDYGMGHHDFYYGPGYYGHYIGPAWNRYPGSYYGYGHRPVTRVDARTYNTTIINHGNTAYAADERRAAADPKYSTYKTASGKTYNGNTVPKSTFKGSNVAVSGPAGDAPTAKTPAKPSTKSGNTSPSSTYGKSSSGSGRSSGGGRR